jgi:hypothetical protein
LWQERLSFLRDRQVPEPVLDRARAVEPGLQDTGDRVRTIRDRALLDLVTEFTPQARTVEADARSSTLTWTKVQLPAARWLGSVSP